MREGLRRAVEDIAPQLIEWRRDFHRHPETAFKERRTSNVIRTFLGKRGIPASFCAGTGVRAVLRGKRGGRTIALRADMDALPIQEEGDKEYSSLNPGAAHACGHDGHMAILMGAAHILAGMSGRLDGNVVFLFQPSEEKIPGGARRMIAEGALEGVDGIFGLHLWQPLPTGRIGIIKGPMMAQSDFFRIRVRGRGGHGSMPHQTVDPILASSQMIVNMQSIVSRNVDPLKPCVVSFGTVSGGTEYNIIPGEVNLTGTVRTFDPALQDLVQRRLKEVAKETCRTFGAEARVRYDRGYRPVVNDGDMVDIVLDVARRTLGKDCLADILPVMGGEDFSCYLEEVPGAFFFFGMGDGMAHPHHHPGFDIDERALPRAVLLMASLALEFLGRP